MGMTETDTAVSSERRKRPANRGPRIRPAQDPRKRAARGDRTGAPAPTAHGERSERQRVGSAAKLTFFWQVSCICIVLFACEHAFRSRRALPQMLPSPRKALDAQSRELMEALQDTPRATDVGYAVAENEVLEEMVEALEVLIGVTRALFGTSSWLEGGAEIAGSFGRSGGATPASLGRHRRG
jgi:hypothetical protein